MCNDYITWTHRKGITGLIPYLQENKMSPEIHIFSSCFLVRYEKRNKGRDKNIASEDSDLL